MGMAFVAAMVAIVCGCGPTTLTIGATPAHQRLSKTTVRDDGRAFGPEIAIIDVTGLILNADRPGLLSEGENPVSDLYEKLEAARSDRAVRGVILRINSPGGGVTASDAMYRSVLRFKESGKPIVALMMDVAASGGYYVACGADEMIAYPTCVTGSVGVIMQTVTFKPALSRLGIHAEAFTSGPNKDAGSPLSNMTDEHRAVLQELVDDFYQRFVKLVRERRRTIAEQDFATVTDGRVVSGTDAAELGLVDRTGDLEDAFKAAKDRAGVADADLVVYRRRLEYVGSPYSVAPSRESAGRRVGTQINLLQINGAGVPMGPQTGFYYLWQQGGTSMP